MAVYARRLAYVVVAIFTGCDGATVTGDAGGAGDATFDDVTLFSVDAATDAGNTCDAVLTLATLPQAPTNCSDCPLSTPPPMSPCDAGGLTCQYGTDPRFGCNVVYQCSDGKQPTWNPIPGIPVECGPVFEGPGCAVDACTPPPLCLGDGGVCRGTTCAPFLTVAPGCPCTGGGSWKLPVSCGTFTLACSDAGRLDGLLQNGPCGP